MTPTFKSQIRTGPPPVGTLITMDSDEVVEALATVGFDWLFIDMEHGPLDLGGTQSMVRAMGPHCASLVRVPENSGVWIRRVLDTGCDGIIVPLVCSAAEVRAAVDAARYPPTGRRSVGIGRAHRYGLRFAEYVGRANDDIALIIQIEHIAAVEAIGEILATPGIDGILIGPYDLSGSMNLLGQIDHPDVQAAIATVRRRCVEAEMPVGIFVLNPAHVQAEMQAGINFLAVGTDMAFMTASAAAALAGSRP
jgi:2-keto-3-deoxy-L-rhamnonate aldolase RhmA